MEYPVPGIRPVLMASSKFFLDEDLILVIREMEMGRLNFLIFQFISVKDFINLICSKVFN